MSKQKKSIFLNPEQKQCANLGESQAKISVDSTSPTAAKAFKKHMPVLFSDMYNMNLQFF